MKGWNLPTFYKPIFIVHSVALLILAGLLVCDLKIYTTSDLCSNFRFNAIWHRWSMAALILCARLANSDVTALPWVTCMDWSCWWYNHMSHLVSSSAALVFLTIMSEKHISASPSAIHMRNQCWREIRCNKPNWKQWMNWVMLASFIVAYVHFVIMLIELQKVLSQELKWVLKELIQGVQLWNALKKCWVLG
jgi:hypothetical protein